MAVTILCRNMHEDRVIPRFSRALRDGLGWDLAARLGDARNRPYEGVVYLSGYFEWGLLGTLTPQPPLPKAERGGKLRTAAYFTHLEVEPPHNAKAKLFFEVAKRVDLRIVTAKMYGEVLSVFGPTVQILPPVERERFVIAPSKGKVGSRKLVAGFSGYTYGNGRKGEGLAGGLVRGLGSGGVGGIEWMASGRGWPVQTRRYGWAEMPSFYQGLDILVVTGTVEGVPMPPLEALSCGVSVVIPREVGLLDEIGSGGVGGEGSGGEMPGIHRYEKGDGEDLRRAFEEACEARGRVNREALRAVTEPFTVAGWCEGHRAAFEEVFGKERVEALGSRGGGKKRGKGEKERAVLGGEHRPAPEKKRGIYVVGFGKPARDCAERLLLSIRQFLPEIPVCFCSTEPLARPDLHDFFVEQPDADAGGRRAKLKAFELVPDAWETVLYLDADTEVVSGDVRFYFELIEAGWEFVICKDPHLMDTMKAFRRAGNGAEMVQIEDEISTLNTLQWNGGVWAFVRNARVEAFFERWAMEWEKHAQRDQGALVRAMYADPLKVFTLGNEWNTFDKYTQGVETAGLLHHVGEARRWKGQLPGRIDSEGAWAVVKRFEEVRR